MSKRVKQLVILAVSLIFIGMFLALIAAVIPEKSSSEQPPEPVDPPDNNEEEIEIPYEDLEIVRSEHIRRNPSSVDLIAEIRNPNESEWGVREFKYTFTLNNLLDTAQDTIVGTSYILPGETKYIVKISIPASYQIGGVDLEIEEEHWSTIKNFAVLNLDVENPKFIKTTDLPGESFRLSAHIVNNSVFALTDIRVVGLLFGENNDIIGANKSSIQRVLEGESREVQMFWREEEVSSEDVLSYEVIAYSNVLDNENFIRRYKVTDGGVGIDPPEEPGSYFQLPEIFRKVRTWWR